MNFTDDTTFLIAQGLGFAGLASIVFAYQGKRRSQILFRQLLGAAFFAVHLTLLSAYTGALANVVIILRNLVFSQKDKRPWAKHYIWIAVFAGLSFIALLFSWHGAISIFPALAVSIGTYAIWQGEPSRIRALSLVSTLTWLPYLFVVHSYPGVMTQTIIGIAILVGIFRVDTRDKKGERTAS